MILGKNLILTVGDESRGLAASKSCDLSIDTDFIEVCSPVNGSWKDYLPTINSWSASVDMLVASLSDHKALLKKQATKEKLMCCFFDTDLQEFYKGYCYIKGLQIKGTIGGLATMGVTLQPTGALEWAEEQDVYTTTGTKIDSKALVMSGTQISISANSNLNVFVKEVSLTGDTRVTLYKQGAVVKGDATTVASWITNDDVRSLNDNIILSNINIHDTAIIKGIDTICFLATARSEDDTIFAKYLSKF